MAKGFRIQYKEEDLMLGSGMGHDRKITFSSVAIYVPKEKLLIRHNPASDVISSYDPSQTHTACIGSEAELVYRSFMKKLGKKKGCKPEEIEIPDSVVEWGKALAVAKNAPEEARKLLRD